MNIFVNGPEIFPCQTIVRSLENQISNEWCFVDEPGDEKFDFVQNSNVIFFVFNLEVRGRVCVL